MRGLLVSPVVSAGARDSTPYASSMAKDKKYGCLSFLFDVILTLITGGLWLIWIFVREMRRR